MKIAKININNALDVFEKIAEFLGNGLKLELADSKKTLPE